MIGSFEVETFLGFGLFFRSEYFGIVYDEVYMKIKLLLWAWYLVLRRLSRSMMRLFSKMRFLDFLRGVFVAWWSFSRVLGEDSL